MLWYLTIARDALSRANAVLAVAVGLALSLSHCNEVSR